MFDLSVNLRSTSRHKYNVFALGFHLCPEVLNPFLLEEVKFVRLILFHVAFLLAPFV